MVLELIHGLKKGDTKDLIIVFDLISMQFRFCDYAGVICVKCRRSETSFFIESISAARTCGSTKEVVILKLFISQPFCTGVVCNF